MGFSGSLGLTSNALHPKSTSNLDRSRDVAKAPPISLCVILGLRQQPKPLIHTDLSANDGIDPEKRRRVLECGGARSVDCSKVALNQLNPKLNGIL
jgi:hypothetical protein